MSKTFRWWGFSMRTWWRWWWRSSKQRHGELDNFLQVFWRYYERLFWCSFKYNCWSIGGYRWWWALVWSRKIWKETTSGLYKNRKYNIIRGFFFLLYMHHKLNFKVYGSNTCYLVNKLGTILNLKYLFLWSVRGQFLTYNSRMSFFQVGETNVEQLSKEFMDQIYKPKH